MRLCKVKHSLSNAELWRTEMEKNKFIEKCFSKLKLVAVFNSALPCSSMYKFSKAKSSFSLRVFVRVARISLAMASVWNSPYNTSDLGGHIAISDCRMSSKYLSLNSPWSILPGLQLKLLGAFFKLKRNQRTCVKISASIFRMPDFSYHGRFVPWTFRTFLGLFASFVPRTFRTILGLFVPLWEF